MLITLIYILTIDSVAFVSSDLVAFLLVCWVERGSMSAEVKFAVNNKAAN